jgi:hypothetical protein
MKKDFFKLEAPAIRLSALLATATGIFKDIEILVRGINDIKAKFSRKDIHFLDINPLLKEKNKITSKNSEIICKIRGIKYFLSDLSDSLSVEKFEIPKLSFDKVAARKYGTKLGLSEFDIVNWHYIYAFGYYPTRDDSKSIGWKESLKEYAKVIKSYKKGEKAGKGAGKEGEGG